MVPRSRAVSITPTMCIPLSEIPIPGYSGEMGLFNYSLRCMVPQLAVRAILAYATSSADLVDGREIEGMIQTIERPVVRCNHIFSLPFRNDHMRAPNTLLESRVLHAGYRVLRAGLAIIADRSP